MFLICFSYITILVFYKPNFIIEENDILKKTNSIPDLILFINKIIFTILLNTIRETESTLWFFLFTLFVFTSINTYYFFLHNNYENKILMKLSKALSLILFWLIFCLVIGKIFQNWNFNGTLHLLFFGIILISFFFIYHKEKMNAFYNIDFEQIKSSEDILRYIKNLLHLIKFKDNRQNLINFNTLILLREENCINKNCKLKKYLNMVEKGYQSDFILYQYCQHLFDISIKKYPNDNILKANYIIYLVTQMSKKNLAQKILATMEPKLFHFQKNYIIFRCKKYIKEYTPGTKKNFEEKNKNIMKAIEYEKIYNKFKDDLSKASSLYYQFWSSLYKSNIQGTDDFIKLNNIGEKLNSLIDNIDENFNNLNNVIGDDMRVINLYSEFLKNIINNKEKYNKLKNISYSLSNVDKIQGKEIDYCNFDLKILKNSDKYKYIIVSAEEENLGIILNISLNACQLFGYIQNEVIGKKINILFPEIYHKELRKNIIEYTNNAKTKFYELLSHKKEYFPDFLILFIEGKSKSKYLIPFYLKIFFTQTEESEHIYVAEILYEDNVFLNKINEIFKLSNLSDIDSKEIKFFNYCYVLTDPYFNIQAFTANCQELLGLNSNALNGNIDITIFIDQFKEDVNKMVYEFNIENENSKNDKSDLNIMIYDNFRSKHNSTYKTNIGSETICTDKKILYKRYIAEKKFSDVTLINWKINDLIELLSSNQNNNSNIDLTNMSNKDKQNNNQNDNLLNKKNTFYRNIKERSLFMVIKKAEILGKKVGYKFIFKRDKIKDIETENELNSEKKSYVKFIKNKHLSKKNNRISFKTIGINESDKKNEGIIKNCKTQNINKLKLTKTFKIKEKNGNLENIIEEIPSGKSSISEEASNIDIKRVSTSPFKKNILKKKPSKFSSFNDLYSERKSTKSLLDVEQNFIPNSNFSFMLDLDSFSFRPIHKKSKFEKDILNYLKNEAMAKIKQYQIMKNNLRKRKITFSSIYEDSESSEEEENSSSLPSNISSPKEKKQNKQETKLNEKSNEKNSIKEKKMKEEVEGHYYKVNGLNKIKLLIYDFEQEMVIDQGIKKDMKSEVENIIINYKLKIPTGMDEEANDPSYKINKYMLRYSNGGLKKEKSAKSSKTISNLGINNQKMIYKKQEIYKRLENELNKNDKEKILTRFIIVTLLSSLISIGICIFVLYFILSNLSNLKNNLLLICYSINLRHYTNMGIYYVREKALLILNTNNSNNTLYTNFPIILNRTDYMQNVTDNLKKVFFAGHQNMESMMSTNLNLNQNNSFNLNLKPFKTKIYAEPHNTKDITSTLFVSIVQIYSFLYHLIISKDMLNPNISTYNFIYNSMNSVGIGIEEVIKIYLSELQIRKRKYHIISGIIIFLNLFLIFVAYYIIRCTHKKIILRKESYFSIFYDISLSFIKSSMIKCEKFISKINPNELLISQEKNEDNEESISFSNFYDDFFFKESNKINNNNKLNNQIRKNINYKEIRIFKIKILGFIWFLFSFIYVFVTLWKYINLITITGIMGYYLYHMQNFHNNILNIFIAYREFIYYKESVMHNMKIFDYLDYAEREFYESYTSDINFIASKSYDIEGLSKVFREIQQNHLCFENDKNELSNIGMCDYYMEIITSLGFYNFVSFWIEEIRIKKNYVISIDKMNNIYYSSDNSQQYENRTINIFNNQEIHNDINFMFIYIILPFINEERNLTSKKIIDIINSKLQIYLIIFAIYFLLIISFNLFFLRPIINGTNKLIYKTKKMLRIIPVEILEAQTNIKNILGVSDLND